MKIICVEANYAESVNSGSCGESREPVVFMKTDSSLLKGNKPFYLPYFSKEIVGGASVVYRISRLGKNIQEKFAHRYYDAVALGMDLTAVDLQKQLMSEGKPWEISKAFDGSAVVSDFVSLDEFGSKDDMNFSLEVDGVEVQAGNVKDAAFSVDRIIAYVSQFFTLKIGDLIYTGTPKDSVVLTKDTKIVGKLDGRKLLDFNVK